MDYAAYITRIRALLGSDEAMYSDGLISEHIRMAIFAVNNRRNYAPTENTPIETKYIPLMLQLVVSSLNKMGAEGEVSHSENSVSRTYGNDGIYPEALLNSIVPLVGVIS